MIIHDIAATQCVPLAPFSTHQLPLVFLAARPSAHRAATPGLGPRGAGNGGLSEQRRNTRHKRTAIVALRSASAGVLSDGRFHLETLATPVARRLAC
jgi:hypothetical protein